MEATDRTYPPPRSVGVGRYRVGRRIGSGSFGQIHIGTHVSHGEDVAIKLEPMRCRHPQLLYEAKIYKMLGGQLGVPGIYWWGHEGDWTCIVIELLGPSLEDLFSICHRRFSLKTVLMLGEQMLTRIQLLHEHSYLHRDIKPDNFLVGTARAPTRFRRPQPIGGDLPTSSICATWAPPATNMSSVVYMLDFGLCKRYRDGRTLQHIPFRTGKSLTGTARYASIATHMGLEQARRDDLEAMAYVMIYFLRGALPWQGLHADTKQDKYTKILEKKQRTTVDQLCRNLPGGVEMKNFLLHVRNLRFDEEPDYAYLRNILKTLFEQQQLRWDHRMDWNNITNGMLQDMWHGMAPNASNTHVLRPTTLVPYLPPASLAVPTGYQGTPYQNEIESGGRQDGTYAAGAGVTNATSGAPSSGVNAAGSNTTNPAAAVIRNNTSGNNVNANGASAAIHHELLQSGSSNNMNAQTNVGLQNSGLVNPVNSNGNSQNPSRMNNPSSGVVHNLQQSLNTSR